jgi:hypothetical protein
MKRTEKLSEQTCIRKEERNRGLNKKHTERKKENEKEQKNGIKNK